MQKDPKHQTISLCWFPMKRNLSTLRSQKEIYSNSYLTISPLCSILPSECRIRMRQPQGRLKRPTKRHARSGQQEGSKWQQGEQSTSKERWLGGKKKTKSSRTNGAPPNHTPASMVALTTALLGSNENPTNCRHPPKKRLFQRRPIPQICLKKNQALYKLFVKKKKISGFFKKSNKKEKEDSDNNKLHICISTYPTITKPFNL